MAVLLDLNNRTVTAVERLDDNGLVVRFDGDERALAVRPATRCATSSAPFARAYVQFATRHAALLELMFAGKHRPGADRLREAADAAFAAPLALFASPQASGEVVEGDPERVGTVALATLQGLASLANNGMVAEEVLDELVDEAVERLVHGLRPR